jgi:hypothetical protein
MFFLNEEGFLMSFLLDRLIAVFCAQYGSSFGNQTLRLKQSNSCHTTAILVQKYTSKSEKLIS